MGALCSLMMLIIVTAYFFQKCEVWYSKKDVDLLSATETGFFNSSYVFDHEQGLNIAVALTAYDNNREPYDESYATLEFKHYWWGQ